MHLANIQMDLIWAEMGEACCLIRRGKTDLTINDRKKDAGERLGRGTDKRDIKNQQERAPPMCPLTIAQWFYTQLTLRPGIKGICAFILYDKFERG